MELAQKVVDEPRGLRPDALSLRVVALGLVSVNGVVQATAELVAVDDAGLSKREEQRLAGAQSSERDCFGGR